MISLLEFKNIGYLLFSIVLLNGCKSGTDNSELDNSNSENSITTATDTEANQIILKRDTVEIKDMKFVPAILNFNLGDTIVFINNDMVQHDITEEHKLWTSHTLESGSSWDTIITQSYNYYCSIHLVMKGKLVEQ